MFVKAGTPTRYGLEVYFIAHADDFIWFELLDELGYVGYCFGVVKGNL